MEQEGRPYSGERFRALAHYLASSSQEGPAVGGKKLADLLFHCDFLAYEQLGDSITGATYAKRPDGPYPACLDKEPGLLDEAGADTSVFTGPELAVIEQALQMLRDQDASSKDTPSRIESLCQYVDEGESISYNLVFVSTEPPSPEATRAAQEVAERLGRVARAG